MSEEYTASELGRLKSRVEACSSVEELKTLEEIAIKYRRLNPTVDNDDLLLKIAYKKQILLDHVCDPNKLRKETVLRKKRSTK
jgi:hypothetical protein